MPPGVPDPPPTPVTDEIRRQFLYSEPVADFSVQLSDPELQARLESAIDVDGKIPRALEALGPISGQRVVLLDADRGIRAGQLEALGGRVSAVPGLAMERLPKGLADVLVSCWTGFLGDRPETADQVREAERVLRPGGRLLVVHDYGRDDVSRLRPDDEGQHARASWSRRDGWFLLNGFRIRVLHCWWTFDSLSNAMDVLGRAFGEAGALTAAGLRRPRLEYKVAVYHRTFGAEPVDSRADDELRESIPAASDGAVVPGS